MRSATFFKHIPCSMPLDAGGKAAALSAGCCGGSTVTSSTLPPAAAPTLAPPLVGPTTNMIAINWSLTPKNKTVHCTHYYDQLVSLSSHETHWRSDDCRRWCPRGAPVAARSWCCQAHAGGTTQRDSLRTHNTDWTLSRTVDHRPTMTLLRSKSVPPVAELSERSQCHSLGLFEHCKL